MHVQITIYLRAVVDGSLLAVDGSRILYISISMSIYINI